MNEYLDLLRRNPNFRRLWLGSVISQLGDWFNVIAAAEIITRLTDSGVALSYLFLARFLPLFLFSPIAGVLADRFDRRRLMVLSDVLRGVTVLGFLFIRDPGDLWAFYLLTVVQFSLSALFTPARGAILAGIVRPTELVAANALDSLTWSTMLALGAFAGGVVAAFFGAEAAFIADSASFMLSAVFIARIALPAVAAKPESGPAAPEGLPAPVPPAPRRFAFLDGFRYLWREPFILGIALAKAGGSLVWGAINVLEITYANDLFPLEGAGRFGVSDPGTATLGLIYVFSGLGTGVGPLVVRRWLGDAPRRLMLGVTFGFIAMTAGTAALAAVGELGPLLAATVARTLGTGTLWVFSSALLQTLVPDRFRGRVFAFEFAALTLTQSVSTLAAGFLLDRAGLPIQGVMAVMAATSLVMTMLWALFFWRTRTERRVAGDVARVIGAARTMTELPPNSGLAAAHPLSSGPMETTQPAFREVQPYRELPPFTLLVFVGAAFGWFLVIWAAVLGRPLGALALPPWLALAIGLPLGILLPLAYTRLRMTTEVYPDRLFVNTGMSGRLSFPWQDVTALEVRSDDIRDDYNIRNLGTLRNTRTAYTVMADNGLQLQLADGRYILIGSKEPEALGAAAQAAWRAARPTAAYEEPR